MIGAATRRQRQMAWVPALAVGMSVISQRQRKGKDRERERERERETEGEREREGGGSRCIDSNRGEIHFCRLVALLAWLLYCV